MNIFERNYKQYIVIPIVLFVIFAIMVFFVPGIKYGIDLRGGTSIIVRADNTINRAELLNALKENFEFEDLHVTTTGSGAIIEFAYEKNIYEAEKILKNAEKNNIAIDAEKLRAYLKKYYEIKEIPKETNFDFWKSALIKAKENFNLKLQDVIANVLNMENLKIQKREIGPALGNLFWDSAWKVALIAVILIIIVIFIFFRELIPSLAIIAAAVFDVFAALAGMSLFGIGLGLASIPALLMLVGYSVDTDILLTTRILKRSYGDATKRAYDAMKTGLTMTTTTLVAAIVMLILSYLTQMEVVFSIAAIIVFGMLGDVISTWLMNAPVLLMYAEKKKVVI